MDQPEEVDSSAVHAKSVDLVTAKPALSNTESDDQSLPIFTSCEKLLLSYACSISAVFSTLSYFIYFPAIKALATSLNVSVQAINLIIMSYLIVSGIAPSFFGDMADKMGRRPVILLALMLYIAANIGLALQNKYIALVILRCLQSAGASSTIAIAYGIISDISEPKKQGILCWRPARLHQFCS